MQVSNISYEGLVSQYLNSLYSSLYLKRDMYEDLGESDHSNESIIYRENVLDRIDTEEEGNLHSSICLVCLFDKTLTDKLNQTIWNKFIGPQLRPSFWIKFLKK